MRRPKQAPFPVRVKVTLAEREMTVTALAESLGVARETLSRAIHHGKGERLVVRIKHALSL